MKKIIVVMVPVLIIGIILMMGCGIPVEEYDGLVSELDAAKNELSDVQDELDSEMIEKDALVADLDTAQMELDDLKAQLDTLIVAGDTVRGHIPSDFGPTCAVTSQWHRGELVVWRFRIWDPETGKQLPDDPEELVQTQPDADQLAAMVEGLTATVHLSDGQTFEAHFGGHGGEGDIKGDYFWAVSWEIPADYPTGTIDDWVTVEWSDGGKTGISQPFDVSSSKMTILE